jgi:hypothetical protein
VRWTLAALCALLVAGCGHGSGSSTFSAADAKRLVLKAADLSSGFESFASGRTASLDVQGTTRSDPERFGREGGWVERLKRSSPPMVVVSTVDVFHDAKGAQSDLTAFGDQFARQRENGLAKRVRPPQMGDGSIGAQLVAPGGQKGYSVVWSFRNASASVTAIGPSTMRLADVVAFARKQQAKLERG